MADMEYEDIAAALSFAAPVTDQLLSRRTVLKAIGAGMAISAIPGWMYEKANAAPGAGGNGNVLVVVQFGGGNDGLNTVVPMGNSSYFDIRKGLAITQDKAIPLTNQVGFHPGLVNLAKRFQAGQVGVVQGVGYPKPDLSHFSSMAKWMSGSAADTSASGWLGRFLDGLGAQDVTGVSIGPGVPLHLQGRKTAATSIPQSKGSLFGVAQNDDVAGRRMFANIKKLGTANVPAQKARASDAASALGRSMEFGNTISSCYPEGDGDSGKAGAQMQIAANLINAKLGIRVIGLSIGSFDTHSGQDWQQNSLLEDFDKGVETFFKTLQPALANKVTMMTFSEFGRRVQTTGSGTDHGTAGPMFLIGNNVKGGLHGEQPSLTKLDKSDNLVASTDFRAVYSSIVDGWLNGDSAEVVGKKYAPISLFKSSRSTPAPAAV